MNLLFKSPQWGIRDHLILWTAEKSQERTEDGCKKTKVVAGQQKLDTAWSGGGGTGSPLSGKRPVIWAKHYGVCGGGSRNCYSNHRYFLSRSGSRRWLWPRACCLFGLARQGRVGVMQDWKDRETSQPWSVCGWPGTIMAFNQLWGRMIETHWYSGKHQASKAQTSLWLKFEHHQSISHCFVSVVDVLLVIACSHHKRNRRRGVCGL